MMRYQYKGESYPPKTHWVADWENKQGVVNNAMQGDSMCGRAYVFITFKREDVTCEECKSSLYKERGA